MYNILGWPAFVGVGIMVFSIPLNTFIARILKKMQQEQMKNRDKRTKLMSELLANIKRYVFPMWHIQDEFRLTTIVYSIKLYAWENAFIRKILFVRNDLELKTLRKIGIATVRSF